MLKNRILKCIQDNQYFSNIMTVDRSQKYQIINLGNNTALNDFDSLSEANTVIKETSEYIETYCTNDIYCNVFLQTKEYIDLTDYQSLKYHVNFTRQLVWPFKINLIDQNGNGTIIWESYVGGEYNEAIDISSYNGLYKIIIAPHSNHTYIYDLYLE